jgi:hypothetical protein
MPSLVWCAWVVCYKSRSPCSLLSPHNLTTHFLIHPSLVQNQPQICWVALCAIHHSIPSSSGLSPPLHALTLFYLNTAFPCFSQLTNNMSSLCQSSLLNIYSVQMNCTPSICTKWWA